MLLLPKERTRTVRRAFELETSGAEAAHSKMSDSSVVTAKNERPIGDMLDLYRGDPQKLAWAHQLLQFLRPRGEGKTITIVGTNPPRILDLYTFYMLVQSRGGSSEVGSASTAMCDLRLDTICCTG